MRQLRANKVALFERVDAWASVFAVGKSSGNQREVWNGANLSSGAAPPPRPPHLANPSCFLYLEAFDGDRVRITKRDARCYFDQLRLPGHLRSWFGRPSLRVSDILRFTDMTTQELASHLPRLLGVLQQASTGNRLDAVFHRDLVLWPVCTPWPMGFAWSSFIAQSQLLGVCTASGLTTERMLADDLDTPADLSAVFALATDDVMLFTLGKAENAAPWAARLDQEFVAHGVLAHPDKAINAALDETVIGIDLVDGRYLAPNTPKLLKVLSGCLHFLTLQQASPLEIAALLGHLSWFALMVHAFMTSTACAT